MATEDWLYTDDLDDGIAEVWLKIIKNHKRMTISYSFEYIYWQLDYESFFSLSLCRVSRSRLESIDSRLGDDLLDDVLIAPSRAHNAMPLNADEVCTSSLYSA